MSLDPLSSNGRRAPVPNGQVIHVRTHLCLKLQHNCVEGWETRRNEWMGKENENIRFFLAHAVCARRDSSDSQSSRKLEEHVVAALAAPFDVTNSSKKPCSPAPNKQNHQETRGNHQKKNTGKMKNTTTGKRQFRPILLQPL